MKLGVVWSMWRRGLPATLVVGVFFVVGGILMDVAQVDLGTWGRMLYGGAGACLAVLAGQWLASKRRDT